MVSGMDSLSNYLYCVKFRVAVQLSLAAKHPLTLGL